MQGICCLAYGEIFDRGNNMGVVWVFSIFWRGWECTWVYVRVYAHTHTHTHTARGVLGCEPRGRDDTPGGPEESSWTMSRHICICGIKVFVYVYNVHMCSHPRRCKTSSVGQRTGLSIPRSSVRFRQKLQEPRSQIYMDLSYIEVLNYCFTE